MFMWSFGPVNSARQQTARASLPAAVGGAAEADGAPVSFEGPIWVVVKSMVPFGFLNIIRHL